MQLKLLKGKDLHFRFAHRPYCRYISVSGSQSWYTSFSHKILHKQLFYFTFHFLLFNMKKVLVYNAGFLPWINFGQWFICGII